jgi:hypothetical protein
VQNRVNEPHHIFHHYFQNLLSSWESHGCVRAELFGQNEDHPVQKAINKEILLFPQGYKKVKVNKIINSASSLE